MIAVIADDFTGAAEIGGLGLKYDLSIEISTGVNPDTKADLLIIAMDTRSRSEELATINIRKIISELIPLNPTLIFKKVDSVLRGHVLHEIKCQLDVSGLKKAIIVPANPSLGRTLVNGQYYLHGKPVHLSSFAKDPEYPIISSSVEQMLRTELKQIHVLKLTDPIPTEGIIIGEVSDANDLKAWCEKTDTTTVIAGASGFFDAMLKHRGVPSAANNSVAATYAQPALLVCGSAVNESRTFTQSLKNAGAPVSFMPLDDRSDHAFGSCAEEIVANLVKYNKAVLAVENDSDHYPVEPIELRNKMGRMVKSVTEFIDLKELLIEGGSTAAAILQELSINTLYPVQQLAPGVIRLKVKGNNDLHITLKPGSYAWPPNII